MDHKNFVEAERINGWREMEPGYWYYIGMENRGTNKWNKPITVVSVKLVKGGETVSFYAPLSLYYGLKSKPETTIILYEGMFPSESGGLFPRYKYAV